MMTETAFALSDRNLPPPANPDRVAVGLTRWREAIESIDDCELRAFASTALEHRQGRTLLAAIFGGSPYLTALAEREPAFAARILRDGPESALAAAMAFVAAAAAGARLGETPMAALRRAKRHVALATAVADICTAWTLEDVTGALSDFADAAIGCAVDYLLVDAARRGDFTIADPDQPQQNSGLIVLGLGKLGGRELNYSSDIDLVVFYDPERTTAAASDRLQTQFVRLTRGLVRLMQERTADGYVFRTDLRLRPDPNATPVAMSVRAAEVYYETLGQNWERAAFIKARAVAGDAEAARVFLREQITPFVWRKNLDFAAIQDIHSIKRQIDAHRGGHAVAVAGHNVKLGRGGIREIEFFAQTQQLIWGGRKPMLRATSTVQALRRLAGCGLVDCETAEQLVTAYRFLRRVEHRLQMINDEQTHTLPTTEQGLAEVAAFLGYDEVARFRDEFVNHLRIVEGTYAQLFEDAPTLGVDDAIGGNLVFTGVEPDPETLATLGRLGFISTEAVHAAVRGWHHGRYPAMRSARARELLTELMPRLLKALAAVPNPDAALFAFDRLLSGLPAGVQLFSMFSANDDLLNLVAEVLGRAPGLAEHLARRASVLEAVLSRDFFEPPPPPERLASELNDILASARDLEDVLDVSRRWANDRRFQVGVQALRGLLDVDAQGAALSAIAEVALRAMIPPVADDFAKRHGHIAGAELAVIAMGKLGGREMTATSDLDLIFVYNVARDDAVSSGPRPLAASLYFARLSQRLINALTAPTRQGTLYEVDMRLRPSGKSGPIAVSFASFERYQRRDAWTWERMALTRARVISGPPHLVDAIESVMREVLTAPRDPDRLVVDVADMRARMDAEHHSDSLWDVKHVRGGLVDIEFIVQYLQLRHAARHPQVLSTNTGEALRKLADAGLVDRAVAAELLDALAVWQSIQGWLRLTLSGRISALGAADAPESLKLAVSGLLEPDIGRLGERLQTTADRVRHHFATLIEAPAAAAAARRQHTPAAPS